MPLTYLFPPYRLIPARRLLEGAGVAVKIGGRAFEVLVALIERRERTVSKHELMAQVWPQVVVEENNLQVQVVALRKLLGHAAIATVPGRGYRFTLPVEVAGDDVKSSSLPSEGPASTANRAANNLPHWLPPLYGRDEALHSLLNLMERHAWVTVVGPAGIGKTRLAQAAAKERLAAMPGGVWWVDLASLMEPSLVPNAVALAIGVSAENVSDLIGALGAALSRADTLLVLDNVEHLLDGVSALLARLRTVAGGLRLLLTSQEVLHAVNEQVFRVEPLSLPRDATRAAAEASGAVVLFAARAQAVDRRFTLTEHNSGAVGDICRHLDGIPLAIELAAARLPLLGVDGLRARLDQRFRLLTGGDRTASRRHRTLREALEWSHQLLSADEQAVFRRLGVFAGGFTLDAAQAVAEDTQGIDGWEVLEHLGRLVDKSLVVAEGDPMPRYRLLETMRLFALEQLMGHDEVDATYKSHRAYFATLAEVANEALERGDARALATLDPERDNLFVALAWTKDDPGGLDGLRLARALTPFWTSRGMLVRGAECLRTALVHPDLLECSPLRCRVESQAAALCSLIGRLDDASHHATRAVQMARDLGDDVCLAVAWAGLGNVHRRAGDPEAALRCGEEALQRARATGDTLALSAALTLLTAAYAVVGQHDRACATEQERLELNLGTGNVRQQAEAHLNLAWLNSTRGHPAQARRHLAAAFARLPRAGSEYYGVVCLRVAAGWAGMTRRCNEALQLYAAYGVQSLRIGLNEPLESWEEQRQQRAAGAVGPVACRRAQQVGRAWSYAEAVACAARVVARADS